MSKWIGAALGLGAGLGSVVGVGTYMASTVPAPKFGAGVSRFDTSTFLGRYNSFLSSMDPSTLLASDDDVRAAVQKLNAHRRSDPNAAGFTDSELWAAQKLKESGALGRV